MKNIKKTIISISTFALVMTASLSPNSCPISNINPVAPISASAAEVNGVWEYEICDGEARITNYTGTDEVLYIPSTLGGFPVRHIMIGTFCNNNALKYVNIPNGVKSIEAAAFRGCENLNMVSLPSSLESIGDYAFAFTALGDVVIPAKVKVIGGMAFSTSSLKTVTIKGNTTVDDSTFGKARNLESVYLNYNYKSNFTTAFKNCENLQYINDNPIVYTISKGELCVNTRYIDIIKNIENNKYIMLYAHNKAMRVVNEVTNSSMTDVQKAKALHDWICRKVVYDYNDKYAWKNHIEESVFLYSSTVCEGYARGYNLLLKYAGIESYYVHSDCCYNKDGETHGWNIVKLGDHYFHIDVCWDDLPSGYYWEWFMNSDDEVRSSGGAKERWGTENAETPKCDYMLGDINKDRKVNEDDSQYLTNYIAKVSGYAISEGDKVLADLDFNGVIDNNDIVLLDDLIPRKCFEFC